MASRITYIHTAQWVGFLRMFGGRGRGQWEEGVLRCFVHLLEQSH